RRRRFRAGRAVASRGRGRAHHPGRSRAVVRGPLSASRARSFRPAGVTPARARPLRPAADAADHGRLRPAPRRGTRVRRRPAQRRRRCRGSRVPRTDPRLRLSDEGHPGGSRVRARDRRFRATARGWWAHVVTAAAPGIRCEFLYEIAMDAEVDDLGDTPLGRRRIVRVTGGTFEKPRLRGTVLPGGGDWLVERRDGVRALDVRITLRTDDGALIFARYPGLFHAGAGVMERVARGELVDPSE